MIDMSCATAAKIMGGAYTNYFGAVQVHQDAEAGTYAGLNMVPAFMVCSSFYS